MNRTDQSETAAVRILNDESEWDALETEWSELFAISPQAATPLRFEWLRTWWRIYGPSYGLRGCGLKIVTIRRGSLLLGVLPLYQGVTGCRVLGARRLGFISTGEEEHEETCPDYLNIMCRPGEEGVCLEAAANTLRALGWDHLDLMDIPENSPLLRLCDRPRWKSRLRVVARGICPIANLQQGFDAYLKGLSTKTRQHARQYLRAVDRVGAVFEEADGTNVEEFFGDLVRLHQERWTADGKAGCFGAARFTEFHRRLATNWIVSGEAVLARLTLGGKALAVLYGFITGSKFDYYQSGVARVDSGPFDSPGTTANLLLMSRLAERGVIRYDFLRGSSSYKERLATEQCQLYRLHAVRMTGRSVANRVSQYARHGLKRALRLLHRKP